MHKCIEAIIVTPLSFLAFFFLLLLFSHSTCAFNLLFYLFLFHEIVSGIWQSDWLKSYCYWRINALQSQMSVRISAYCINISYFFFSLILLKSNQFSIILAAYPSQVSRINHLKEKKKTKKFPFHSSFQRCKIQTFRTNWQCGSGQLLLFTQFPLTIFRFQSIYRQYYKMANFRLLGSFRVENDKIDEASINPVRNRMFFFKTR